MILRIKYDNAKMIEPGKEKSKQTAMCQIKKKKKNHQIA